MSHPVSQMLFKTRSKTPYCAFLLPFAVAASSLVAAPASGQDNVPQVTRTYAIRGASVTTAPGRTIENATVVLRDGIVAAVGANVNVPADAHVIDADSMFVYPAFIDGLSHVGIPEPRQENRPRPDDPGNPGYERAGVQPQASAAAAVESGESTLAAHRQAGFAVAHVVPRGRMLPGSSSITSLGVHGPSFLKDEAMTLAQFAGAQGAYPGTPVGVMAHFRQLYREADRHRRWREAYEANPSGLQHPPGDVVLESLFPVISGERPVVFHANSVLEVQRAVRLQQDLGFTLVLAGAEQAAEMIQPLADYGVPLILTVALPEEKKEKEADADSAAAPTAYNAAFISHSEADMEEERKNLLARQKETSQRYLEAAAALEKAGVAFGFAGIDVKSTEFLPNVRKMVEAGLSTDAALAGLTINNARILGIDRSTGTIENGKLANVVVTTAPLFDEDAQIRYVFVNGDMTELEVKEKKPDAKPDEEQDEEQEDDPERR